MKTPVVISDHPYFQIARDFRGDLRILCSIIGIEAFGRLFGWKVLYLVRSKKTVREHCSLLGLTPSEDFPEVTSLSYRSDGLRCLNANKHPFWSVVSGLIKIPCKSTAYPEENLDLSF